MNGNIQAICAELDVISKLYNESRSIDRKGDDVAANAKREMENVCDAALEKLEEFKDEQFDNATLKTPKSPYARLSVPPTLQKPEGLRSDGSLNFKAPLNLTIKLDKEFKQARKHTFFGIAGLAALVVGFLLDGMVSVFMTVLSVVGGLLFIFALSWWYGTGRHLNKWFKNWEKSIAKWEDEKKKWIEETDKILSEKSSYFEDFVKFETEFLAIAKVCEAECQKVADEADQQMAIIQTARDKELEILKAQDKAVLAELNSHSLINSELYGEAGRIAKFLKQGRASDLKEAINLAFDEMRREKEEKARREEARRREEILEQQAEDNRAHNAQMARQAEEQAREQREHDLAMEAAARDQARAARMQADAAQKQAEAAKRQSVAPCAQCVNYTKCSYNTRSRATANCGGFRPR